MKVSYYRQPGYGEPGCENLINLPRGYYPAQIAANQLLGRGDKIARLVYNRIVHLKAGDPVFAREFNRRVHVAEATVPPLPGVPLRIGLDQGLKGAAVIAWNTETFSAFTPGSDSAKVMSRLLTTPIR